MAGLLKPTDQPGTDNREDADHEYYAILMGMERLFDRPGFELYDTFTPLQVNEQTPGNFSAAVFMGFGHACKLDALLHVLKGPEPRRLKLASEDPLSVRWLAWLLNDHEAFCCPRFAWPHWVENFYSAGESDEDGDNWHELEGEAAAAMTKEHMDQWKKLKADRPYFFIKPNLDKHTREALALIKRRDAQLAEILTRLHATRKSTKHFNIREPLIMPYLDSAPVLDHCMQYIHYNLQQGNMECSEPFFDALFTLPTARAVVDDLDAFLQPVQDFTSYAWKLSRKYPCQKLK